MTPRRLWHRYPRFWGAKPDADVDDELRFHLEMRAAELRARGIPAAEALARARELFGPVTSVRDECASINRRLTAREQRETMFRDLWSDVRYAARRLRHSPAFTLVAVATLALGIGANTTTFSLVDAILLHPLPGVPEPGRLFDLYDRVGISVSYPTFRDQQEAAKSVATLAGFRTRRLAVRAGEAGTTRSVGLVGGNYFDVVGARAQLGRLLTPADDRPDAPPAAVVSDAYWRTALGGSARVLGQAVFVSGMRATIVGVAEPGFRGTRLVNVPDLWVPIATWAGIRPSGFASLDINDRGWGWLLVLGRLRPGVTLAQARAVIRAAGKREAELYPRDSPRSDQIEVRPSVTMVAGPDAHGPIARFMAILLGVTAIVLMMACLNIANLLVARNARRSAEVAVRIALGATRVRLIRQLTTEAALLGLVGGGAAIVVAFVSLEFLRGVTLPGGLSLGVADVHVSWPVLAFCLGVALLTTLLFGLVPALRAARDGERASVRDPRTAGSASTGRIRDTLLVAQVALSLVLLVGAGLFARGLARALAIDLGFQPNGLAAAAVNTGLVRYDTTQAARYLDDAASRMATLPGVSAVVWTVTPPLSEHNVLTARIEGFVPQGGKPDALDVDIVSPGYTAALGARIDRGRDIGPTDRKETLPVCVVNEAFVKHYWNGENPIGKRIVMDDTMTVIGVASDVKVERLDEPPTPVVYQPLAQHPHWALDNISVLVRTRGDPEALLASMRRALSEAGAEVPVYGLRVFGQQLDDVLLPQRTGAWLLGTFSMLALIVSAVGIFGLVAYTVNQRTRELGIRIALGAPARSVLGLVMGHNVARVALGIAIGIVLALAGTRVMASFLFGVSPRDAVTFGATTLLLGAVAIAAAYFPARRAFRVDPVAALRAE